MTQKEIPPFFFLLWDTIQWTVILAEMNRSVSLETRIMKVKKTSLSLLWSLTSTKQIRNIHNHGSIAEDCFLFF